MNPQVRILPRSLGAVVGLALVISLAGETPAQDRSIFLPPGAERPEVPSAPSVPSPDEFVILGDPVEEPAGDMIDRAITIEQPGIPSLPALPLPNDLLRPEEITIEVEEVVSVSEDVIRLDPPITLEIDESVRVSDELGEVGLMEDALDPAAPVFDEIQACAEGSDFCALLSPLFPCSFCGPGTTCEEIVPGTGVGVFCVPEDPCPDGC